jgi:hypothetical protein
MLAGLEGLPQEVKDAAGAATGGAVGGGGNTQGANYGGTAGQASSGTPSTAGQASSGTQASEDTAADEEETSPVSIPGLYGTATELSVDVSRLPRLDEYESMVQGSGTRDVPSDVKTVTYYLGDSAEPSSPGAGEQAPLGGLVRRSLDRAVSEWAYSNGGADQTLESEGMLAPQVTGLSFAYFDGTSWLDTWDSELDEGLPLAVEVTLVIAARPPRSMMARAGEALSLVDEAPVRETVYRQVIHLPAAQPLPDTTEMGAETESDSESTGDTQATQEPMR